MRLTRRFWSVIIAISLMIQMSLTVLAESPEPHIPLTPPLVPEQSLAVTTTEPTADSKLQTSSVDLGSLPPLKAVLVVGPIDGDDGPWTQEEKNSMDLAASELQANGVAVQKFYTPNNDWELIKSAAQGAHFLLYRGHGVYWGDENFPTSVGGFALKDGIISPDVLRAELHLAPNAIVMLYGCFTAGTSSNDTLPLTSTEAQRRVLAYSQPFIENGAGGYFANWFDTAFQMFVRYLFQGQTLGQAYETFFDFNADTVERYSHPSDPRLSLWLDKDEWYDPKPQYNNAFVGLSSATLADLFATPVITVSPANISYLTEPLSGPTTLEVQINTTLTDLFWTSTVSPDVSWVATPNEGIVSEPILVTLTPPPSLGLYQAMISVEIRSSTTLPVELLIPVSLSVTEQVQRTYLPAVTRGH